MKKFLVLCHGNINRSPSCAAVLAEEISPGQVRSAGFKMSAKRAAKKSRTFMHDRGYELGDHVPQQLTREMLEWADVVVYMDGGNKKRLDDFMDRVTLPVPEFVDVNLAHYLDPPGTKIHDPAFISYAEEERLNDIYDGIVEASKSLAAFHAG
jgi:protein-tyrosine phosphatase